MLHFKIYCQTTFVKYPKYEICKTFIFNNSMESEERWGTGNAMVMVGSNCFAR